MVVAGLDFGTQSVKLLVYDTEEKRVIADSSHPFDLISKDGGVREQMAEWFIAGLKDCFCQVDVSIKKKIRAIGVSGQQHGFVPVDKSGKVLAPVKLWCDTSTSKECDELMSLYGSKDALISEVGNAILPGYTASKILSFKKRSSELFNKMSYVMLPHDYINYYLTGNVVTERGDASGTALFNVFANKWDEKLCSLIDDSLINKMPKIVEWNSIVGIVKDDVREELGLSDDIVVSTGGGDNMMSAIGTGTVKDGLMAMSLGTSGTLFAYSDRPIVDKRSRIASFASSTGGYLPLLCTMNCTIASENMRKLFSLSVDEFSAKASSSQIGSEGLVLLPYFNGERVPNYPNGEGVLAGMNMTNINEANIARATLEGVSFGFLLGLEAFKEAGFKPTSLALTGGGSNSALWRQIIADSTSLEVKVPVLKETAAFGAALQAFSAVSNVDITEVANGHILFDETKTTKPNEKNKDLYMKAYQKWKNYSDTLKSIFAK